MTLKIEDFIDIEQFQLLQDRLNEIYSFPSSIIDSDGKVLTATAWQDICTKFHRQNSESLKECIKSDQYIADHLHEANPAVSYRCPHGLIDNATPIIIDGVHYGNYFTGQFFLEPPDIDFYRARAKKYGFDEEAYIEAVKKVPIWTREKLNSYLFFIKGLIEIITAIGLKNLREIEARKRIQESEERQHAILQTAMDGFWMIDMQGRVLEVNDTYCRMSGYTEQELLGMSVSAIEAALSPAEVVSRLREIRERGEARFETRHRRKDGTIFDIEVSVQYWPVEGGKYVTFMRDITERKKAEETLRESEARYRSLFNFGADGIVLIDPGTATLTDFNKQACTQLGYTPEEFGGLKISDIELIENQEEIHAHIRKVIDTGYDEFETIHRTRHGERRNVHVKAQHIFVGGKFVYHCIWRDITERRRLESQLQQAMKMEAVGRLAGGVAHDFNNLLTVITGYCELLMEKIGKDSPMHGGLEEIQRAGVRASALTQQLLAFSRKQIIEPKVVRLDRLVVEVHAMLARLIGEDIDLQTVTGKMLGAVKIDPGQFQQILMNLAVNARDAMPGGGKIVIETANVELDEGYCALHPYVAPGRFVMLSVSDTGTGMSEEVKAHIFEPFFTTKERGSGTGLGLATTYGAVRQAGGSIDVESRIGKGTTFRIYLPRIEEAAVEQAKEARPSALPVGSERILLVEDEDSLRMLCVRILADLGYRVIPARNGTEAIRLATETEEPIHLLLTDVVMPGMSGSVLATQLVLHHPEMKILFMSGYTDNAIVHHGVLDAEVSFIGKPYSPGGLARKVREVLDKP